jgi:hypothetical protein
VAENKFEQLFSGDAFRKALEHARAESRPVNHAPPLQKRRWVVGFGPVTLQPGERRRIDAQLKCRFEAEKIVSQNAGVHLLALYFGKTEVLGLNGDSIDLGRTEIALASAPVCDPALSIELELVNRCNTERAVCLSIIGSALL